MNTSDDDLLAALQRSADPADRRLAGLLRTLAPTDGHRRPGPRASESLADFLASSDPDVSGATGLPTVAPEPEPDLVVRLAPPPPHVRPARSGVRGRVGALRAGVAAKALLGAALALSGVTAVAAGGVLSDDAPERVVATPSGVGSPATEHSPDDNRRPGPQPDRQGPDRAVADPDRDPQPDARAGHRGEVAPRSDAERVPDPVTADPQPGNAPDTGGDGAPDRRDDGRDEDRDGSEDDAEDPDVGNDSDAGDGEDDDEDEGDEDDDDEDAAEQDDDADDGADDGAER